MSKPHKTEIIKFRAKEKPKKTSMEKGLQDQFWRTVKTDTQRLTNLFLAHAAGYTTEAELYAQNLVILRAIQGREPSAAQLDLQKAYAYALSGNAKGVMAAFDNQTRMWREAAIEKGDPRYLMAVQQSVTEDNSEEISFFIENWFSSTQKQENVSEMAKRTNPEHLAEIIFQALQEVTPMNGVTLRDKIEGRAGAALTDNYLAPDFTERPATRILRFAPR